MNRLDGRIALVTGGGSGIGRAAALRLAEEGAAVVVTDIREDAAKGVAGEITTTGGRAIAALLDVAEEAQWAAIVELLRQELGGLDILVNNAGMGELEAIEETTPDRYARTIAVNQTGVYLGLRATADLLKASEHASVINMSSIFGTSGGFGTSPAYHAAKGAVRTLTKNVALHWAAAGVRVNSVHPGFIDTPILAHAKGTEYEGLMLSATPMGRLGRPEEVAAAIAFLASDDASYVTGTELYVDGGYIAR